MYQVILLGFSPQVIVSCCRTKYLCLVREQKYIKWICVVCYLGHILSQGCLSLSSASTSNLQAVILTKKRRNVVALIAYLFSFACLKTVLIHSVMQGMFVCVYLYLKKGKQPYGVKGGNSSVLAESLQDEFSSRTRYGLCARSLCYVCVNNCSPLKTLNGCLWLFA